MLLANDFRDVPCVICGKTLIEGYGTIGYCNQPDHLFSIREDGGSDCFILDFPFVPENKRGVKAIFITECETAVKFENHLKTVPHVTDNEMLQALYDGLHGAELFI